MGALAGGAVALSLAACTTTSLSGTIAGAGASSQEAAMNAWVQTFMENNDGVTVSYDAVGSGGGRTQFIEGGVQFAGTDAALKADELADAEERCGGTVIEHPRQFGARPVEDGHEILADCRDAFSEVGDMRKCEKKALCQNAGWPMVSAQMRGNASG